MKRYLLGLMGAIFAAVATILVFSPADAVTGTGTVNVEWHQLPIINFTLTPNYYTGYGAVLATFGTQPAPTHGPGAPGTVDFGTTIGGDTYLYKYAAHLHVTSNDTNGFYVYGEAATVLTNNGSGQTYPGQYLYYLPSGASSDSNTGFTPGLPFALTIGSVSGSTLDAAGPGPTITYTGYPNAIAQSATANNDFYYDYQFKVPNVAAGAGGNFYIWIVYTVVGQ
ncbi:MAG TPA: hypothetical protein VMG98_08805 [Verrucomicrobiae bacterium]|nr:hypothetical protein [Verrucomicrobiae bacterium]